MHASGRWSAAGPAAAEKALRIPLETSLRRTVKGRPKVNAICSLSLSHTHTPEVESTVGHGLVAGGEDTA